MATEPVREDFLDFPTAWRIQREDPLEHLYECSSVAKPDSPNRRDRMAGPAFLCDCGAVQLGWELRVRKQRESAETAVDRSSPHP